MKWHRLVLLLCIVPVSAVQAQQKFTLFSSPFYISTGVDSAVGGTSFSVGSPFVIVSPVRPTFTSDSSTSSFTIAYRPEFELIDEISTPSQWNHYLEAYYTKVLNPVTRMDVVHSSIRSADPARVFSSNLVVLRRSEFREHTTAATLTRQLSRRTNVSVRMDSTLIRNGVNDADVFGQYVDPYGVTGTLSLSHRIDRKNSISAYYSLLKFSPYPFEGLMSPELYTANVLEIRAGIARFGLSTGSMLGRPATTLNLVEDASGQQTFPSFPDDPLPPRPMKTLQSATLNTFGDIVLPAQGTTFTTISSFTPAPPPDSRDDDDDGEGSRRRQRNALLSAINDPFPTAREFAATSDVSALRQPFHLIGTTYSLEPTPGLVFDFTGGILRDEHSAYLFRGEVRRSFHRFWFSTGMQHFITFYRTLPTNPNITSNPLTPLDPDSGLRSNYTAAALHFGGSPSSRFDFGVSMMFSRNRANFATQHIGSFITGGRVNYWLKQNLSLFFGSDVYFYSSPITTLTEYERLRFSTGVQVHLLPVKRRPVDIDY